VDPEYPPEFRQFVSWTALKDKAPALSTDRGQELYRKALGAARVARAQFLESTNLETLQLLAAADGVSSRPRELTTGKGFRVTLSYEEGNALHASSICVLVRCPAELAQALIGQTVSLWTGSDRFELGQFDAEGKAIGTLPAGLDISFSDFASGKVRLEEPPFKK